jgi:hypothetical protein
METPKTGEGSLAEQQLEAYFRALEQGETRSFDEWKREGAQFCMELEPDEEPAATAAPAEPEAGERFTDLSALLKDSMPHLFDDKAKPAARRPAPEKDRTGREALPSLAPPAVPPEREQTAAPGAGATMAFIKMAAPVPGPAPVEEPEEETKDAAGLSSLLSLPSCLPPLPRGPHEPPPLAPQAFHGIVGEVVRAIDPHTEADPAAVLLTFLAAIGNLIGPGPHAKVEASRHGLRLFVALVGESSKARKGTSEDRVRDLLRPVDPLWEQRRIQTGISSGEGIIAQVRDEEGGTDAAEPAVVASRDPRMLLIEPELGNLLKVMNREGNTASPVLRCAWDGKTLQTLTKNYAQRATGAHISLIGHTTRQELRRYLNQTEAANGFGNRFLWVCVRRSKILPFGGRVVELGRLSQELRTAVAQARQIEEVEWGQAAGRLWASIYGELSAGAPGLFGAVTGRAEAQVLRLAALYAVLDGHAFIQSVHLLAALAVWGYCETSAALIFGYPLGDPLADLLEERLKPSPKGLIRTHLWSSVANHYSLERFNAALALLERSGRARVAWDDSTGGRPAQRWFWVPDGTPLGGSRHLASALAVLKGPRRDEGSERSE